MKRTTFLILMFIISNQSIMAQNQTNIKGNPLIEEWQTPFQTPPFSKINNKDYKPAIEYAIKEAAKEVLAIANNKEEPSFENTIVALERSGQLLHKITSLFFNLNEANTNDTMQELAVEISPLLTKHSNDIYLNPKLFSRVKNVYENSDNVQMTTEEQMLLRQTYKAFVANGAMIDEKHKDEFRNVSKELSILTLRFNQNVLADNNTYSLVIKDKKDLDGLPQYAVEAASELAKNRKTKGWIFTLDAPSYIPFITYADNRELREQIWRAYNSKGNHNDTNDNKETVIKIVNLRLRLAQLLGYENYAAYNLDNTMAKTQQNVNEFLDDLLLSALPFAKRDLKQVSDYAKSKGFNENIERWDFSYWSEKLKNEKYAINPELIKPYFRLGNVIRGIFALADTLYGLEFRENKNIDKYHNDVSVYEVWDKKQNKFMAVLYMDFFPRESKRGGAWMTNFREQYRQNEGSDVRPLIQMVCNFTKPTSKSPSLLTFEEVNTMLHEFGHCLHGILSECTYSSISGTNVYHDFVELPSQLMENFSTERAFLDMFAEHYNTQEKIPQDLIDKLVAADQYMAGWLFIRQLFFGLIDMNWHSITEPYAGSVEAMEAKASQRAELLPIIEGCMMTTQFGHIFGGGYAAGYYGYKWAEVLDADAFSLFKEKGVFNKSVSTSFRENILSKGGSKDPMLLYKAFRGHTPSKDALLRRCRFIK
ncbi:MAG: M3 family metallopeptidase [Bacteroidales bacterium]|jgi:peptidyl-dipeptidase Dcp|nr:M3 family metallopeptidase [Bacteroidales bacterium]